MSGLDATKVGEVVAMLYHHLLGSSVKEQQRYALELLKRKLNIDSSYWAVIEPSKGQVEVQSLGFADKHKRRFDRTIKTLLTQCHFNENEAVKSLHQCADRLLTALTKLKLEGGQIDGFYAVSLNKEVHLLLLMTPVCQLDPQLVEFLFARFVHSLKVNRFARYHNDRIRPNSYKAICDKAFRVIEAEKHFFALIEKCSPQLIVNQQLSEKLRWLLGKRTVLNLDDIVYNLSYIDDFVCIEIYFDDPRVKRLAPKRQEVLKLIYLDREEIAKRLDMSIRTLDDHFAAIYDEFGTREKKKILAETHQFPQVDKIRQAYR